MKIGEIRIFILSGSQPSPIIGKIVELQFSSIKLVNVLALGIKKGEPNNNKDSNKIIIFCSPFAPICFLTDIDSKSFAIKELEIQHSNTILDVSPSRTVIDTYNNLFSGIIRAPEGVLNTLPPINPQ